jgi:hypothetical protein
MSGGDAESELTCRFWIIDGLFDTRAANSCLLPEGVTADYVTTH